MSLIEVTKAALTYIQNRIQKENGIGFRLTIKKTGCSGFSYVPEIIPSVRESDSMIEIEQTKIFLDAKWLDILQNIKIDYVEEDKLGLKQKRLVFINAKETSRCGCGESFHLDEDKTP